MHWHKSKTRKNWRKRQRRPANHLFFWTYQKNEMNRCRFWWDLFLNKFAFLYFHIRAGVKLVSIGLQMSFFFFRIKETWITLESLKEDCTFFENWLINIKLEIDSSASDQMNTNFSKEEIQHFEVLLFVGSWMDDQHISDLRKCLAYNCYCY